MSNRVTVSIHGDASGFNSAMKSVKSSLTDIKGMVAGYFTVQAITELTTRTFEYADSLVDASLRLGMLPEQLQVLKEAAKQNNVEFEKLQSTIEKITIAKTKALKGDKESIETLRQLGVNKEDYKKNSGQLLMENISATVRNTGNVENLATPLSNVFGNKYGAIVNLLQEDMSALGDKMRKLGTIMDSGTAVKLKVLGDEFKLLGNILLVTFAPAILKVGEMLIVAADWLKKTFGTSPEKQLEIDLLKGVGGQGGANFDLLGWAERVKKLADENKANPKKRTIEQYREQVEQILKTLNAPIGDFIGDTTPTNAEAKKNNKRDIYSDSLTAVGNMLGQSYSAMSQVTTQIDLQRQTNNKIDKTNTLMEKTVTILEMTKNTAKPVGFDLDSLFANV
jgi:hypothetical protein